MGAAANKMALTVGVLLCAAAGYATTAPYKRESSFQLLVKVYALLITALAAAANWVAWRDGFNCATRSTGGCDDGGCEPLLAKTAASYVSFTASLGLFVVFVAAFVAIIVRGAGVSFPPGQGAPTMRLVCRLEAAVAGGIPIIKAVQESLIGNHIQAVVGIINGTCNYILTRMSEAGLTYEAALDEAQTLGYAEADPTLDVNGWDAAHKAIILASLSYGRWVPCDRIHVEGIERVRAEDIAFAGMLGYTIKLLGVIRLHEESGSIEVRPLGVLPDKA